MERQRHDLVLAFDFGGTKLAAGVVNAANGEIYAQVRRSTPARQGAKASLEAMLLAGREALEAVPMLLHEISGIGISFGGPVSPDRRRVLRSMHVPDWESYDLPAALAAVDQRAGSNENLVESDAISE